MADDINVLELLQKTLADNRCSIFTRNGIWYITTPKGVMWDMTVPQVMKENMIPPEHKHGNC